MFVSQSLFINSNLSYLFASSSCNFSPEQNLYLTFSRLRRLRNLPFLHILECHLTKSFHHPRLKKLNELFPIFFHGKFNGWSWTKIFSLRLTLNYVSALHKWKIIPIFSFLNFDFLIIRLSFSYTSPSVSRSSSRQKYFYMMKHQAEREIV